MTKKIVTAIYSLIDSQWENIKKDYELQYSTTVEGSNMSLYIIEAENRGRQSHPFYSLMILKDHVEKYKMRPTVISAKRSR